MSNTRTRNKDEVANELIEWHFTVEAGIAEIYRIISENEEREDEPIKLLEVDPASSETGRIDAFYFNPADDITYPSVVALVTPRELSLIKEGILELPEGWDINTAKLVMRPTGANSEGNRPK